MNVKNSIIFIIIILLSSSVSFSQNKKMEKANSYYEAGEYLEAIELYEKLYSKAKDKKEKAKISFNTGNCCRMMYDVNGSLKWYKRAIIYKYQNPISNLYLANSYKMKEEYEDAKEYYTNYKNLVPDDPRGEDGIISCDLAMKWLENPTRYKLREIRYFNTKYNDFAPAYAGDSTDIYFTSTREGTTGKEINKNSGESFADLFFIRKDKKGKWSEAVPAEGMINTPFDEGSCSLTPNGRTMYYTSCEVINGKDVGCKILKSSISEGKWGTPETIKIFSDTAISVGHPHITPNELTLFFVADHPERGIGGKDIWKMERKTKSANWNSPQILGSDVNTKYNELFPTTDLDGNLYFSSDGRIGMGGLDIFIAKPNENGTYEVENMKSPINSFANDFAIIFNPFDNKKNGYVTSSRESGKKDDIFYFYQKPLEIILKGYVRNKKNRAFMPGVEVKLDGSNGELLKTTTGDTGDFTFKLSEDTDYSFITTMKNYLKGKGEETTKGITVATTMNIEIFMEPALGDIKISNIEYALGDTTLSELSKVSLGELIELLEFNPITIELKAHTDYRGSDKDNLKLSQGRANSVVAFLIENGIDKNRLVPKGYGESSPVKIDSETAKTYPFLKQGDVLNPDFIDALEAKENKDICHQLNRRTEFKVLSSNWGETYTPFGEE